MKWVEPAVSASPLTSPSRLIDWPGATALPRSFIQERYLFSIWQPLLGQVSRACRWASSGVHSFSPPLPGHQSSPDQGMKYSPHSGHGTAHSWRVPDCQSFQMAEPSALTCATSQCQRPETGCFRLATRPWVGVAV
ncbi:hypothetical protein D3C78_1123060 [compost metagenome]